MTENEQKLWRAIDQVNGQIEVARTYCYDFRLCDESAFNTLEGAEFQDALTQLIRYGAIARLRLREILKK